MTLKVTQTASQGDIKCPPKSPRAPQCQQNGPRLPKRPPMVSQVDFNQSACKVTQTAPNSPRCPQVHQSLPRSPKCPLKFTNVNLSRFSKSPKVPPSSSKVLHKITLLSTKTSKLTFIKLQRSPICHQ